MLSEPPQLFNLVISRLPTAPLRPMEKVNPSGRQEERREHKRDPKQEQNDAEEKESGIDLHLGTDIVDMDLAENHDDAVDQRPANEPMPQSGKHTPGQGPVWVKATNGVEKVGAHKCGK